jgi:hypothetical protein
MSRDPGCASSAATFSHKKENSGDHAAVFAHFDEIDQ